MAQRPVDVEVRGVRELQRGMRRLAGNIDRGADEEFRTAAEQVATIVRGRVPRRTGTLAGSVEAEPTDKGARVAMGAGVPYAGWIEFGGTRGRPYIASGRYLTPTALDAEPLLQRAGETAARKEIGRMRWPTPTLS
jgi:phage gpG-like protein